MKIITFVAIFTLSHYLVNFKMVLTDNDIHIEGTSNITNAGENRNVNNDNNSLSTSSEGKCLNDYIDHIKQKTHN